MSREYFQVETDEIEEIKEKLKKFARVVEYSPSSVVITDLEGNIEYVNPKFTSLTGYTYDEVIGENPRILKSDRQDPEFYRELWETITSGEEWRGEFCNLKKNGELYWEDASISPIKNEQGEITHFIGIKKDITEQKQMEKELQQAKEEAEKANKAKSAFLAEMSHEIRTPMNGIIGLSQLLLSMELPRKQCKYLKMINSSGKLLLDLINDILDLSKIEAGKLELTREIFNLRQVAEQLMETFMVKAHNQGLELVYKIDPQIPEEIIGDAKHLKQVLINLIGNALKFTEEGEVVLEINLIERTQEYVRLKFSVKDTGIGIERDQLESIFDSFNQLNGQFHDKQGTGLGLSISREIIKLMGSELEVDSKPGLGSNFYFKTQFPVAGDNDNQYRALAGRKIRALILDENQTSREFLANQLRYWGVSVNTSKHQYPPGELSDYQLVLLNSNMGKNYLQQLAGYIQSERVILLHNTDFDTSDLGRELQPAASLIKPPKISQLLQTIRQVFNQKQAIHHRQSKDTEHKIHGKARGQLSDLKILVAEDNQVNQQLTTALLENRGWQTKTVTSGKQVLDSLEKEKFDLVLMDVKMPELDGLETTRKIRKREQANREGQHLPIIALTAYALKEDKQRCLEAGMDDYLAKPVEADQLYKKIGDMFQKPKPEPDPGQTQPQKPPVEEAYKQALETSLANMKHNRELLHKVSKILLDTYPEIINRIEKAIKEQDGEELELQAHSLKGSVRNLAFEQATGLARKLEKMGKNGDFPKAENTLEQLKQELSRIDNFLRGFNWEQF